MFRKFFVTVIQKMDWSGYRWKQKGETKMTSVGQYIAGGR